MKKYNLSYLISIEVPKKTLMGSSFWYSIPSKTSAGKNDGYSQNPIVVLNFVDGSCKIMTFKTDQEAEKEAERIMKLSKENKTFWI